MSDESKNIVSLASSKEVPCDEDAFNRLEECLRLAREGGLDSFAITMVCNDGTVVDSYHCKSDIYTLIGAIEAVKQRFISKRVEYAD